MSQLLRLTADADIERVRAELLRRGADAEMLEGAAGRAVLVRDGVDVRDIPGVDSVLRSATAHPCVDRAPATVAVGTLEIGGQPVLMAGPCAAEDEATVERLAAGVAQAGAQVLRGGAHKPRTSPYSFRGHGDEALGWLRGAADRHGLALVTEALDVRHVGRVAELADLVQIGSRNMHNQPLLIEAGRTGKPVLLKRGAAATVAEWLLAAEHILDAGAPGVVLCERGIRALPQPTRNTLDLGSVAWLLAHHSLPVIVDPSHAAGRRELIAPLCRAAWALGCHGVLVEVHDDPARAASDGAQALPLAELAPLAAELKALGQTRRR
ncbi:MAG: 3-deoxy-7-phosphoheptulonate synthase [Planctomycetota bacterium]